jgi:hypothetical protein
MIVKERSLLALRLVTLRDRTVRMTCDDGDGHSDVVLTLFLAFHLFAGEMRRTTTRLPMNHSCHQSGEDDCVSTVYSSYLGQAREEAMDAGQSISMTYTDSQEHHGRATTSHQPELCLFFASQPRKFLMPRRSSQQQQKKGCHW